MGKVKREGVDLQAVDETVNVKKSKGTTAPADLISIITSCLDDNKAEEINIINLKGKSGIADYLVIANGRSSRQVAALTDYVMEALKDKGVKNLTVEGLNQADWVLIDAGDIIIHIFRPEVRLFYNLDKMWSMALQESVEAIS